MKNLTAEQKAAAGCDDDEKIEDEAVKILNVIVGVSGTVALVVIVIGGIMYMTAVGDASKLKRAKDTILYGVIGLIIVGVAFAIGNFAIGIINSGIDKGEGLENQVQQIISGIVLALGLVAVVVIVIGGILYMTSTGDAGKLKRAKDTIIYGIVGRIICALAFAIVNFVVGKVNDPKKALLPETRVVGYSKDLRG